MLAFTHGTPRGSGGIIWIITSKLTKIITNNASVALAFFIAVMAAQLLGVDSRPFFVDIAFTGASIFMTGRGYRSNLIIKAIGKYSSADFLSIGAPMLIIAFILSVLLISWLWSF